MKKMTLVLLAAVGLFLASTANSNAGVHVGIYLGGPSYPCVYPSYYCPPAYYGPSYGYYPYYGRYYGGYYGYHRPYYSHSHHWH
jgi:hypothetical protein